MADKTLYLNVKAQSVAGCGYRNCLWLISAWPVPEMATNSEMQSWPLLAQYNAMKVQWR